MAKGLEFWFRRKFNLAPTDPRFLNATLEQMETEFWAHHYHENPPGEELEDDDFDKDAIIRSMEENPEDWEAA